MSDDLGGPSDLEAFGELRLRHRALKLLQSRGDSLQSLTGPERRLDAMGLAQELTEALARADRARDGAIPVEVLAERARIAASHAEEVLSGPFRPLTPAEAGSLQLIVETRGRPALELGEARIAPPLEISANELWGVIIALRGAAILQASRSVGAVLKAGSGGAQTVIGTGWRAPGGHIVTNRHVVRRIAEPVPEQPGAWRLQQPGNACIDFAYFGTRSPSQAVVDDVVFMASEPNVDLAILRVDGADAPALPIEWTVPVAVGQQIYTIGHPESALQTPELALVMGAADGRKRVAPGEVDACRPGGRVFEHDCSTLSGNSGSCALDLADHRVRGLHYGGRGPDMTGALGEANLCLAFAGLTDHDCAQHLGYQRA